MGDCINVGVVMCVFNGCDKEGIFWVYFYWGLLGIIVLIVKVFDNVKG